MENPVFQVSLEDSKSERKHPGIGEESQEQASPHIISWPEFPSLIIYIFFLKRNILFLKKFSFPLLRVWSSVQRPPA